MTIDEVLELLRNTQDYARAVGYFRNVEEYAKAIAWIEQPSGKAVSEVSEQPTIASLVADVNALQVKPLPLFFVSKAGAERLSLLGVEVQALPGLPDDAAYMVQRPESVLGKPQVVTLMNAGGPDHD